MNCARCRRRSQRGWRSRPSRGGERGAAEVVAVQMVEGAAALDRNAQADVGKLGGQILL